MLQSQVFSFLIFKIYQYMNIYLYIYIYTYTFYIYKYIICTHKYLYRIQVFQHWNIPCIYVNTYVCVYVINLVALIKSIVLTIYMAMRVVINGFLSHGGTQSDPSHRQDSWCLDRALNSLRRIKGCGFLVRPGLNSRN